ncbi:MAG: citrate/2-methylcitrate synthase [Deltaproteobacteria bacterium]|nr:citrate/2-methylcitrate synthase [Deltaproteobacteria bacterium]
MAEAGKGLEGVVAGDSSICFIDGDQGILRYRGYAIDELATNATFEEVVYALWHGDLPNNAALADFKKALGEEMSLPPAVIDVMRLLPKDIHPMAALRTAFSVLGNLDPDAATADKKADDLVTARKIATRVQAQIALLVPAWHRIRTGQPLVAPRPELSLSANFLLGMTGEVPSESAEAIFDECLTLHADHELNASTFACRVISATLADIHSALGGGIGALKGPLHGGANTAVMMMLHEIDREGGVEAADAWVKNALDQKKKISGFGHRVYRTADPRATRLKILAAELAKSSGNSKWFDLSRAVEDAFNKYKNLPANVDFYSASTYTMLGIPADMFTPIFAVSRASGWLAHVLEQYSDNRLIRPRARYTGSDARSIKPIADR